VILFAEPERRRRRPNLTPMIDVVFLLLVFFMMAARFGAEATLDLALAVPGGAGDWQGPPRLVAVSPTGVALNGVPLPEADLPAALAPLMAGTGDAVVLRPADGADLQRLVDVVARLTAAGIGRLYVAD
jgi:biopolymer transport protein ExbD